MEMYCNLDIKYKARNKRKKVKNYSIRNKKSG